MDFQILSAVSTHPARSALGTVEDAIHYSLVWRLIALQTPKYAGYPMKNLTTLADHFEQKARLWSVVFNLVKWPAFFNILLFALYCFTSIKRPFSLIYGASPSSVWYSVGVATLFALVIFISYHRAHRYLYLSECAREESAGSNNDAN